MKKQILQACAIGIALGSTIAAATIAWPLATTAAPLPAAAPATAASAAPAPAPAPAAPARQLRTMRLNHATRVTGDNFSNLGKDLERLLSDQAGTFGYYLLDLNTGASVGYQPDKEFPAASTFKLPLAMYLLQQVDAGQLSLDEQLTLQEGDWEDGTGVLLDVEAGTTYTISELLDLSIKESDNIATNMLLDRLGGREVIWSFEQQLGGTYQQDGAENETSPADLARYMELALRPTVLSEAARTRLLGALAHTAFPVRIAAGVPEGVPVAHKIGTLEDVVNDIGYVQVPDHPYILAICSQGVSEGEGDEVLAQISEVVYQFYAKQR